MKIITESDRLYLREFTLDDAVHFYQMNTDSDVIKYTGDKPFKSIKAAREFLSQYNQYELYKMGRWAVCDKVSNEFLGWCGLKFHPKKKLVEVGYRFYKKHWNKGYATESTQASINYGFETLKIKEIYAHAHINNLTSHKVIEKCNLKFINEATYDNMPAKLYKIENPFYHIKPISAKDTYSVRHPVLRLGRPISDCEFEGDAIKSTLHLGLFFKENLIGVATFIKNNHSLFSEKTHYQLRGMAILEDYQKKGLGSLLIDEAETLLAPKCHVIWFNARKIALNFYTNQGYQIIGDAFMIPKVGMHFMMFKKFNP